MPLLSEMMYPLEEDTLYLLLRGTSSHREKQSLHLLFEPKGVECLFPLSPVLLGSEGRGLLRHRACFGSRGQRQGSPPRLLITPVKGGLSPF